jgi:hypothetical protein
MCKTEMEPAKAVCAWQVGMHLERLISPVQTHHFDPMQKNPAL